jgi:hypothetical protein
LNYIVRNKMSKIKSYQRMSRQRHKDVNQYEKENYELQCKYLLKKMCLERNKTHFNRNKSCKYLCRRKSTEHKQRNYETKIKLDSYLMKNKSQIIFTAYIYKTTTFGRTSGITLSKTIKNKT